jgi:hypothetical protein
VRQRRAPLAELSVTRLDNGSLSPLPLPKGALFLRGGSRTPFNAGGRLSGVGSPLTAWHEQLAATVGGAFQTRLKLKRPPASLLPSVKVETNSLTCTGVQTIVTLF